MVNTSSGEIMGDIQLRIGYNEKIKYGGHIGYNVLEKFRGNNYASRSVKLLFPLARQHGMQNLIISCNPNNIASKKTIEKAGGELVEVVDLPESNEMHKRGERKKCIYNIKL